MEENGTYRWSASNQTPPEQTPPKSEPAKLKNGLKKLKRTALIAVAAVVLVVGIMTSYYTVDDKQQAVVTTFGKVTNVTDAGVHFRLPFGIQRYRRWM